MGEAFPPSLESVKTRLTGLLGEVRVRGAPCVWLLRRAAGLCIRALGGKGTACGEIIGGGRCSVLSDIERGEGDNGEGEKGIDPAEGDCDLSM